MENIFWEKEKFEISNDELIAYTLSKIKPFAWVRRKMYDMEDIFRVPPVFCWRFSGEDENVYRQLRDCLEIFKGNVKWIIYKGESQFSQSSRNYTIEPLIIYDLRKTIAEDKLPKALEAQYQEEILKSVADIKPLCRLIEEKFRLENVRPHLPIIP